MNHFFLLGVLSLLVGCLYIYLASPNQLWLRKALPVRPARVIGFTLLVFSLFALCQTMQVLTAVFIFATGLMLVWVLLPYIGTRLGRVTKTQKG